MYLLDQTWLPFANLMLRHVYSVLMICSDYDRFMLEEDGRVEEELYKEYTALGLSSPPKISHASNEDMALLMIDNQQFDLVISMLDLGSDRVEGLAKAIKDKKPEDLPQDLLREPAQRQVRLSLMLAHIVGENKIGASREEVEARAREIASAYQQPEEMVKWLMGQQEQANRVAEGVIEAKLVDFVLGKAKTTDEAIAFDQLMGNEAAAA